MLSVQRTEKKAMLHFKYETGMILMEKVGFLCLLTFNFNLQNGNNELAVLLYSEAMKYAPVHETLWEGDSMAIAAANR